MTLPAGKHILRMDVTAEYFDVDYFNFEFKNEAAIRTNVHMATPELADYDVFDVNGVRLGRMSAYSLSEAVSMLKNSNSIKIQGVYMLRSVKNGAVKTVRITR